MRRCILLLGLVLVYSGAVGCALQRPINLSRQTGGSAFLFRQFQAFDGQSGKPLTFADVAKRSRSADVVLFGEQHGNAVCNQLEAQVFESLLESGRPLALAMEFFETDAQPPLDSYLAGRLDEPGFIEAADRQSSYLKTHRPLIEICRAAHLPVIAANAPRSLVRAFRKSGLDYDAFCATLKAEQRQWLPANYTYIAGAYRSRFAEIMGASDDETADASARPQPAGRQTYDTAKHASKHPAPPVVTQPAPPATVEVEDVSETAPAASAPAGMPHSMDWREFYRAQLLWDEAMSESVANYRRQYPRRRVMLVVGGFHVEYDGGTAIKLRQRRPQDRVVTIAYRSNPDGQFAFDPDDRGAGDIVVYGLTPPKPKKHDTDEKKHAPPPTASQPTSAPTSAKADHPHTDAAGGDGQ